MTKKAKFGAAIVFSAIVAGCTSPRDSCIAGATSEYRTLQRLIAETQQNVARGYALHSQQVPYTIQSTCYSTNPYTYAQVPYSCPSTAYRTQSTPVAIDVREERAKLAQYQRLLPQYTERANAGVKQCQAQFPEST